MRIIGVKRCLAVCLVCVLTVIAVGCNNNPNYSRISGIAYENGYVRENSSKTDTLQSFPPNKGALLPWGSDNF